MKNTGTIFGLSFFCIGFSSLFATWMSGVIYKATSGYTWVFIASAILCLIPIYCLAIYDKVGAKRKAAREARLAAEASSAAETPAEAAAAAIDTAGSRAEQRAEKVKTEAEIKAEQPQQ